MPVDIKKYPSSSYSLAYKAIGESYIENGKKPLSVEEVKRKIRITPGIIFPPGTTLDDVIGGLLERKFLLKVKTYGSEEDQIIPLAL